MTDWQNALRLIPNSVVGDHAGIRVIDILDLLANGLSHTEILEELPDLEKEDILAALKYASRKLDHPVIAA